MDVSGAHAQTHSPKSKAKSKAQKQKAKSNPKKHHHGIEPMTNDTKKRTVERLNHSTNDHQVERAQKK